ncbi:LysE family translocator [Arthrobacter cupressi]|uniref:Threonine/homoserine/homoserine lactone efflux protein n=1 Tax=Arthrobacter cupressi TaxID=1045773 RepID=A0A1G8LK77_9MICC|nr:LysE family transporter [Arthrobacter cupressi]NYD77598.1 threonine/homoserine/homoserine lactone efflux protein [Arthrobacter cupressi]SDI56076.1 Threonine/homoserine/homoserine lactone efflux protein [Arthrobacter cupressi]
MDAVLIGLSLGATAGVSPGPLLVLVVMQTLRHGWRGGTATAVAPMLSDALVIVLVVLALDRLPHWTLSAIGLLGGVYLAVSAGLQWRKGAAVDHVVSDAASARTEGWRALLQGALVNLLSPHPWITWAAVLGPLFVREWHSGPAGAYSLVAAFYLALIGAKVVVALLLARFRHRFTPRAYSATMRSATLVLGILGLVLTGIYAAELVGTATT